MEPRTIPARRGAPSPVIRLRPYQAEVARAVLDSVLNRRGLTFTVEMALIATEQTPFDEGSRSGMDEE